MIREASNPLCSPEKRFCLLVTNTDLIRGECAFFFKKKNKQQSKDEEARIHEENLRLWKLVQKLNFLTALTVQVKNSFWRSLILFLPPDLCFRRFAADKSIQRY